MLCFNIPGVIFLLSIVIFCPLLNFSVATSILIKQNRLVANKNMIS
jgi:hypothetical protein